MPPKAKICKNVRKMRILYLTKSDFCGIMYTSKEICEQSYIITYFSCCQEVFEKKFGKSFEILK